MSDLPVFQVENVSGGCYSYTIRKLEKVSKLERSKWQKFYHIKLVSASPVIGQATLGTCSVK